MNLKKIIAESLVAATFFSMNLGMVEAAKKPAPPQQKIEQTTGERLMGEFAPQFAYYNDDVLFGEIWSRTDKLSLRDRSIITVTALMSSGILNNALKSHITHAKEYGVTKEEMTEILTHLAFYAGWPKAWAALNMAKEVYAEE